MHTEERKSHIGNFFVEGKLFTHYIFINTDDRVECQDEDGKVILIHTADCAVKTPEGKRIGRWSLDSKTMCWMYTTENGKMKFKYGTDLLRAEMEISAFYIQTKDQ